MYQDKALVPTDAVKLAALGVLMDKTMSYADLARDIRYFVARVVGPSLDLLGSSLEILRLEGLIENKSATPDPESNILAITLEGKDMFADLMSCSLRTPPDDATRLVMALKLRFLTFLDEEERLDQIDLLREIAQTELARFEDLKKSHGEDGYLGQALDMDITQVRARLSWLDGLEANMENATTAA